MDLHSLGLRNIGSIAHADAALLHNIFTSGQPLIEMRNILTISKPHLAIILLQILLHCQRLHIRKQLVQSSIQPSLPLNIPRIR
jgi:hypothetical protein